jgi:hypothetical protein
MDPVEDERILEAFEEKLVNNPDEAYGFALTHFFPEFKETDLLANPLIIAETLPLSSIHRLEQQLQVHLLCSPSSNFHEASKMVSVEE